MANLTHAELITPERVLFSGEAEAVVMRTEGGDITFLANHMDFIGAVEICVVRIEGAQPKDQPGVGVRPAPGQAEAAAEPARSGEEQVRGHEVRAAVHGGFVMVADNKVTIAAAVAELAEEIDVARANRALEAAQGAPVTPGDPSGGGEAEQAAATEAALARARVRLEAAAAAQGDLSRI